MKYTKDQMKTYLIDCLGYSEEDLVDANYEDLLNEEDYMNLKDWIK
jgi:hypothetical protein